MIFKRSTSFNISHTQNKVTELGKEAYLLNYGERVEVYQSKLGEPLVQYFGYKTDGIWLSQAQIDDAIAFFAENKQTKIIQKLQPLQDVGLGYVQLGQSSSTLSGGEAQRIKLASFLVKGVTKEKALFVFDEPTTGLHFHDIKKLLASFDALIEKGHSIIVIEHNLDLIKCADWIIDLGPEGGENGGQLLAVGTPEEIVKNKKSVTGSYLKEKL